MKVNLKANSQVLERLDLPLQIQPTLKVYNNVANATVFSGDSGSIKPVCSKRRCFLQCYWKSEFIKVLLLKSQLRYLKV